MSQYLPYGNFEWVNVTPNIDENFILSLKDNSETGYIFQVDLEYPDHLHTLHNDYPLAPERLTLTEDMLSSYARSLLTSKYKGTPKLIPNLMNKVKYTVHYRNLKLYLQLGMKLQTVHKVLKFNQSPWLRSYINFNTDRRKEAKSSFEKDFFKLLNNSIYGKTMENLRKRKNIELCNDSTRAQKLAASPNFKGMRIFENNLVAVERLKPTVTMNRPIYVGFCILELSKYLMFDFHYNVIKNHYGNKATLLFTDTDSLAYVIETPSIRADLEHFKSHFDFSDYPHDDPLHDDINKKVIGKFKDELNGKIAYQFVGLKAKMYSLKSSAGEQNRAKGVSTRIVRNKLTHDDYVTCLQDQHTNYAIHTRINQQCHQLYTIKQNKKCLSPFDDKRYILNDGITSYAYGHKDSKKYENCV